MALPNQNYIQKEIKSRLSSDIVYYFTIQNILSSCLPSTNITPETCKAVIYHVVCWYAAWSDTLRDGCKLIVFKNVVLMRVFGYKRDEETGGFKRICVIGDS
jgi:hypothetical protein